MPRATPPGTELETAAALVATCASCAALHRDLRAIAAALPELPAPRRTRDFRLTPAQAASLRPAGWRRILAPFAGPRFAFAAPLGSGLAALGIAGILARRHGPAARQHGIGRGPRGCPQAPAEAGSPPADVGPMGLAGVTAAPAPAAPSPAAAAPSPGDMVTVQGESATPGASPASLGAPVASADSQSLSGTAGQPAAVGSSGRRRRAPVRGRAREGHGHARDSRSCCWRRWSVWSRAWGWCSLRLAGRSAVRTP